MLTVDNAGNISLTRGDTGIFTVSLVDEQGEPFTPGTNDVIRFAMAKGHGVPREEVLIYKDIDISTMTFQINPEDTKPLSFATYKYDVEYTDAFGHVTTVIMADFKITKEVY